MFNKINYVADFISSNNIDVLGVGETWLLPSVPDSFVGVSGFDLSRCDVVGSVPKHGVCVYVRRTVDFVRVEVDCPNCVIVHLLSYDVYVIVIYRPPSYGDRENSVLSSFLEDFCGEREVVVLGDFNLPALRWTSDGTVTGSGRISAVEASFMDCFLSIGFTQWICEPTFLSSGNTLDLILTTDGDRVSDVSVHSPFPNCQHSPVACSYTFQMVPGSSWSAVEERSWFRGDYRGLSLALDLVDWDFEFLYCCADRMFSRFRAILLDLVPLFVPLRSDLGASKFFRRRPPSELLKRRTAHWLKYKEVRSNFGRGSAAAAEALSDFQAANIQYRDYSRTQQIEYESTLMRDYKEYPKRFHHYVRSRKVGRPNVGPLLLSSGATSGDFLEMAEEFASSFSSVYLTAPLDHPFPHQFSDSMLDDVEIRFEEVQATLAALNGSSAMGPDGLHPVLLKTCSGSLAYPLMRVFQSSLREMSLPSSWKQSLVVPLFKKGTRSNPLNYRPISLTSVCCKSLERILGRHILEYLESNLILSDEQFGFRAGRSTEDQLILTYDYVSKSIDRGLEVFLVLFDFSKAFDVVDHALLLTKLRLLGVGGSILGWLADFLIGREMSVVVGGRRSRGRAVRSGVPQGSVLGPLLCFLVFINYVCQNVKSYYKLFADDLKLVMRVGLSPGDSLVSDLFQCQKDIDILHDTAMSWGLRMNSDKCSVLLFGREMQLSRVVKCACFSMGGAPIKRGTCGMDLGVMIDPSLKFHQHIASVACKAGGLATNLLRATLNREASFMVTLYVTHVRPLIDYCSCLWNTEYDGDLRRLEAVQRRWTRSIAGLRDLDYTSRLRALDLYSIKGRLLRADLLKYWKIFHGKCAVRPEQIFSMAPIVGTRGHDFKIAVERPELECRKRSFSQRRVQLWNSLPAEVVSSASASEFKSRLHMLLSLQLFEF